MERCRKYITKTGCNKTYRKKVKDKKLIKNWRPISLLNINTKPISKVLAERLKKVFPSLISKNQTARVKGRFISEGGRLISAATALIFLKSLMI